MTHVIRFDLVVTLRARRAAPASSQDYSSQRDAKVAEVLLDWIFSLIAPRACRGRERPEPLLTAGDPGFTDG